MRLKYLSAVALGLGVMGCSGPSTQPGAQPFKPHAPTPAAGRLALEPRSELGLVRALMESPMGVLEVRLEVDARGKVRSFAKVGGSDPMYFQARSAFRDLRFIPKDPKEQGPWVVFFVIQGRSSGHGSAFEAMHSGSSHSSGTLVFQVVDVTPAPTPAP